MAIGDADPQPVRRQLAALLVRTMPDTLSRSRKYVEDRGLLSPKGRVLCIDERTVELENGHAIFDVDLQCVAFAEAFLSCKKLLILRSVISLENYFSIRSMSAPGSSTCCVALSLHPGTDRSCQSQDGPFLQVFSERSQAHETSKAYI